MPNGWMVRAGEGGYLISEFEKHNCVAIHWLPLGDITNLLTREEIKTRIAEVFPNDNNRRLGQSTGILYKFMNEIGIGDIVISYNVIDEIYIVGEVIGDYRYQKGVIKDHNNIIPVNWVGNIGRDDFSDETKKSLNCKLTVFSLNEKILDEINRIL